MGLAKKRYDDLLSSIQQLVDALNGISKGKYAALIHICERINQETTLFFNAGYQPQPGKWCWH
jgi:hypothetical protein